MNIQQLEYILAVEEHQSFSKAAEARFITQPALSMMVQKLEEELDIKIFDRSRFPILPTDTGRLVLEQARVALREISKLQEIVRSRREVVAGELSIGIIPTLAPYLLPLFLSSFLKNYPTVHLKIFELTTELVVDKLKRGQLDAGLVVTPLPQSFLRETPLFNERFYVYAHEELNKQFLLPEDIDPDQLWLLEEGHCLRSQIFNLCELRKKSGTQLEFEAGSIDTLIKLVDHQGGVTILPELATFTLTQEQLRRLRSFASPEPVREVSLVTHRDFIKKNLFDALQREVLLNLPPLASEKEIVRRIEIGRKV